MFRRHGHGCDSCGTCEVASCDSCCDPCANHRGGLLHKLFGNLRGHGCLNHGCDSCCEPACGCESSASACGCSGNSHEYSAPTAAPVMEAAPMPPAPVVDPSARISQKRRVIQASAVYTR
jgi:hypothetical protein